MVLQRWLTRADGWRDVMPFESGQTEHVQSLASRLLAHGAGVAWRLVGDDGRVLSIHDGRRWQAVAEADTTESAPMPWWEPAAKFAEALKDRRRFLDTIPIQRK